MHPSAKCLVCGKQLRTLWAQTRDVEYFSLPGTFSFYHCEECDVLSLFPVPRDQLNEIYPPNYYSFDGTLDSPIYRVKEWLDKRLFRKILKNFPDRHLQALDVGGGTGWMLEMLRKTDSRVKHTQVVDLNEEAICEARERGHGVHLGSIESYETEERYDVILMLSLIEHVYDPVGILTKLRQLLTAEGVVVIKTPNFDSLDAKLFRHQHWAGYHCPRHWALFTKDSFSRACGLAGLRVRQFQYTQGAPGWAGSVLNWLSTRGYIEVTREKPMLSHPLSTPLLALFAAFDILRLPFAKKTSQMFFVLELDPTRS